MNTHGRSLDVAHNKLASLAVHNLAGAGFGLSPLSHPQHLTDFDTSVGPQKTLSSSTQVSRYYPVVPRPTQVVLRY
jgi:hypothetical protein